MKKLYLFVTMLLLTAVALTGCGCRNVAPAATTQPTTMPTIATTQETTAPTTTPSVETTPTIEDGNGPISTDSTESMERSSANGHGTGNGITGSITG